jgi:hypothetical protein
MVPAFTLENAMRSSLALVGLLLLGLSACATPPNLKSASDYHAPAAPTVRHPLYDPYAPYGQANATWRPPVFDRAGTIVRPVDPSIDQGRPDYEHAEWATGAAGGSALAPPGTF